MFLTVLQDIYTNDGDDVISQVVDFAVKESQKGLGGAMMRWGAAGLAVPDPLPIVDEILFGTVVLVGAGLYVHASLPYGSVTSYPVQSQPVTSTTGHSQERKVKKQISSTSRSNSYRRRKYYYGKKRRYY